ncbi:Ig-like domain-containing protein [Aquimarina agarivorans]|uniref:Ig-like domain-containing protein n=1 Tax=Aquimarina agarivorans TaxID=980584 RepID=UPI001EE6470C|nr:Ig-like domain-containing protein [Aquimarina agarivorans]
MTSGIGGGAGYTIVTSFNNWIIDVNDGDILRTDDGGYTGLTKKRVATLQLERRHTSPYENARWTITNRQGRKYSMGGNASERDDDILINRRPRLQVVLGEEYEVEFARAVDLDSEGVRFSLFQYSIPDGSQSVTLRFKGMANVMRPTFFETGEDVQQNSQLRFLRRSNSTTYFPDPSSGDLFVKVFNNGVGVQSGYINMVPVGTPPVVSTNAQPSISFTRPNNNNQTFTAPGNLTVNVNASDSDGSISNVKLFINNRLVRQENTAPYDWGLAAQNDSQLKNLSAGTYTLRAVATDNDGATKEVSRRVTVSNPNAGLCDFTRLNGGGRDIGSGLGKTFIVGNNRRVWERVNNRWVRLPDGGFRADRVDVGGAGQPMVLATDGKIYRYSPDNRWVLISGSGKDIGANRNELYIIGNDDAVYRRNSASRDWTRLNPPVKARKLDVYSDGNPWIVGTDGFVYQLSSDRWSRKGTFKARDISIAEGTGNVWALSESNGSVYFYEGNRVWSKQSNQTGNHISVGDDNRIWVLNDRGNVFNSDCVRGSRRVGEKNIDIEANLVKLHPNPASNQVTISGLRVGIHHITLYDMQGATVFNTNVEIDENLTVPLSLLGIESGMYILKIKGQGTNQFEKLIIQ